jgi:hypothetical protein
LETARRDAGRAGGRYAIEGRADQRGGAYLEKVADWVSSLSFPQLVRAIYAKYPKYKANSVFAG